MSKIFKKSILYLSSWKFVFIILLTCTVLLLIGSIFLSSKNIYPDLSVYFIILLIFLIIGISLSLKQRISTEIKRYKINVPKYRKYFNSVIIENFSPSMWGKIINILAQYGWKTNSEIIDNSILITKGRMGVWGSFIFHFGLIITFSGIIIDVFHSY